MVKKSYMHKTFLITTDFYIIKILNTYVYLCDFSILIIQQYVKEYLCMEYAYLFELCVMLFII